MAKEGTKENPWKLKTPPLTTKCTKMKKMEKK